LARVLRNELPHTSTPYGARRLTRLGRRPPSGAWPDRPDPIAVRVDWDHPLGRVEAIAEPPAEGTSAREAAPWSSPRSGRRRGGRRRPPWIPDTQPHPTVATC